MFHFTAWNRLRSLRMDPFSEQHGRDAAGRGAEAAVSQYLMTSTGGKFEIFSNRRVHTVSASSTMHGPDCPSVCELDHICVGHIILCLEVKNWSGSLHIDPHTSHWIQVTRTGGTLDHGNVARRLIHASQLLSDTLCINGVSTVQRSQVVSLIVLVNSALIVDRDVFSRSECRVVVHHKDILSHIPAARGWIQSLLSSMYELITGATDTSRHLTSKEQRSAAQVISRLPTWDVVHKANGETVRCNVTKIVADGKSFSAKELRRALVSWQRSSAIGLVYALVGVKLGTVTLLFRDERPDEVISIDGPEDSNYVRIRLPLQRDDVAVLLNQVDSLELNNTTN